MIKRGEDNVPELIAKQAHGGTGSIRVRQLLGKDQALPEMPGHPKDFDSNISFLHKATIPPGVTIGLHTHIGSEEFYYILDGKGLITVNGESMEMKQGDVVLTNNGDSHAFKNVGKDELHMIVVEGAVEQKDKV